MVLFWKTLPVFWSYVPSLSQREKKENKFIRDFETFFNRLRNKEQQLYLRRVTLTFGVLSHHLLNKLRVASPYVVITDLEICFILIRSKTTQMCTCYDQGKLRSS